MTEEELARAQTALNTLYGKVEDIKNMADEMGAARVRATGFTSDYSDTMGLISELSLCVMQVIGKPR